MPDHVRQRIRESAVSQLAGVITAGGRIYGTRRKALDVLPAVAVYTGSEEITATTISPKFYDREVQLIIEAYAEANADVENVLDTLAAEIETELSDTTLGGNAMGMDLTEIETAFWDDDANSTFALIKLTFTVRYATIEGAPTVAV